jgi:preprotein translocase subunit SecB
MYINEIVWQHFVETNAFENQSSKVWKVVTLESISSFFNNIQHNKILDEKQKNSVHDFVLVVVKGLFFLSKIDNICMKRFDLWKDSQLMFPSCKTLIDEVLLCMMKCTFQKFVLFYVNVTIFITTTFDLWMNKDTFYTFGFLI